ncbi:hypothetical protein QL285_064343 [Trifolium repens]|nr:hypothetical protein QL285_064343 [Trifolium repens]
MMSNKSSAKTATDDFNLEKARFVQSASRSPAVDERKETLLMGLDSLQSIAKRVVELNHHYNKIAIYQRKPLVTVFQVVVELARGPKASPLKSSRKKYLLSLTSSRVAVPVLLSQAESVGNGLVTRRMTGQCVILMSLR